MTVEEKLEVLQKGLATISRLAKDVEKWGFVEEQYGRYVVSRTDFLATLNAIRELEEAIKDF